MIENAQKLKTTLKTAVEENDEEIINLKKTEEQQDLKNTSIYDVLINKDFTEYGSKIKEK